MGSGETAAGLPVTEALLSSKVRSFSVTFPRHLPHGKAYRDILLCKLKGIAPYKLELAMISPKTTN